MYTIKREHNRISCIECINTKLFLSDYIFSQSHYISLITEIVPKNMYFLISQEKNSKRVLPYMMIMRDAVAERLG